jgi:lactoylglutathione lyase
MAEFLHTMVRITDPKRSRAFYEALGFEFERDMDIVRDGELEATNYFFGIGDQKAVLELTYNHDGRTYELGTGYGHIALAVDDMAATRTDCARAARSSASSATLTSTGSSSSSAAAPNRGLRRDPPANQPRRR